MLLGVLVVGGLMMLGYGVDRLRAVPPAHGWARVRAMACAALGVTLSLAAGAVIMWWRSRS